MDIIHHFPDKEKTRERGSAGAPAAGVRAGAVPGKPSGGAPAGREDAGREKGEISAFLLVHSVI